MTATPMRPPSTSMTVPLTNVVSSEARKTAALAIASGGPNRAVGGASHHGGSWVVFDLFRTTPGEIALTRTLDDPNSAAQARVSVSIAPFVDA